MHKRLQRWPIILCSFQYGHILHRIKSFLSGERMPAMHVS